MQVDPLRVWSFTPWYPTPDAPWQGTFVKSQTEALRERGVDVRVFTVHHGHPFIGIAEVDPDGRRITPQWRVTGARGLAALMTRPEFPDLDCDVMLAQGNFVPVLLRHAPLPVVGMLRGSEPLTLSGARRNPISRSIIARALHRMDGLVAVGVPILFDLPGDLRDRTTVIENGVHVDTFTRRTVSAAARMSAPDFPRLITVGHVCENKNQELLLRNFPRIREVWPRATWTIVGDGVLRPAMEKLRDDMGLRDAVHFAGRLSPTDLARALGEADLFVMPSLREAFGNVYLEAMAVGVPTLMPRNAGVSFLTRDPSALHDPTDIAEIIAKARAMLATPESYEQAVERGRRLVERCTWSAHAERMESVLRAAVARRSAGAAVTRAPAGRQLVRQASESMVG
jgi:glycosyltransferase involved in cell wall biosynthesis